MHRADSKSLTMQPAKVTWRYLEKGDLLKDGLSPFMLKCCLHYLIAHHADIPPTSRPIASFEEASK